MFGNSPIPSHRVLLVDGDFRTSRRLASLLEEDGFTVEAVRNGASAIARLVEAPVPDVLITELNIPLGDGATLARFALEQRADMRIIILTRFPNSKISPAFGATPPTVLAKPVDYDSLLRALASETGPAYANEQRAFKAG